MAALVLIKDKGAPTGQPIDAYAVYVRAYNGSGPAADAHAERVLADAHAYRGAGTVAFGPACSAALGTPIVPGTRARILPSGDAYAVGDADDPPVIIRNRPRRTIFNTGHPAHSSGDRARKYSVSLALELAYLRHSGDAAAVYDGMVSFLEVL